MNGGIGLLGRQNIIFPPYLLRQDFRRGVADGQSLLHQPQQHAVAESRRQRVNGHHPPGIHRRSIHRLKGGIGHVVANEIPADCAVKDVLAAVLQLLGGVLGIEKSQIQPSGGIRHRYLGHIQALADMGGAGGVHHHGPEAGRDIRLQLFNVYQPGPVLVTPGKMADQILQGEDIQIRQLSGSGLPHAFEQRHRIGQFRHRLSLPAFSPIIRKKPTQSNENL